MIERIHRTAQFVMMLTMIGSFAVPGRGGSLGPMGATDAADRPEYEPGKLIVMLRDSVSQGSKQSTGERCLRKLGESHGLLDVASVMEHGDESRGMFGDSSVYLLSFPPEADVVALARRYLGDSRVKLAQPRYHYRTSARPADPRLAELWAIERIRAEEAWEISTGHPDVVVAVLDTGADRFHPDLASSLVEGMSFVTGESTIDDYHGHGTHVSGTIAAVANNGLGIAGLAYFCKVMPVKVLDMQGGGYTDWIAAGIRYATDRGARVINMSFGGWSSGTPDLMLKEACEYAAARGVVLVAAAGNSSADVRNFEPASYPEVIAVGASAPDDTMAGFSNWGEKLELSAPGVEILSTSPGGSHISWSGTSMACPHVAALAALVASVDPALASSDIRRILVESADDIGTPGRDLSSGYGRINASRALRAASPPPATGEATPLLLVSGRIQSSGSALPPGLIVEIRNPARGLSVSCEASEGGYLAQFADLNGGSVAGRDETLEFAARLASGEQLLVEPARYVLTGEDITDSLAHVALTITTQAKVSLDLIPGHNLIGLPLARVDGQRFRASEIARTCGASWVVQVSQDVRTGRGRFEAFLPEVGLNDFEVDPSRGIILETNRAVTVQFSGRPASRDAADIKLWPGLNAIAFPDGVRTGLSSTELASLTGSKFVVRTAPAGVAGEGVLDAIDPTLGRTPFPVEWLKGYVINSPAGGTIHLPSRGDP